jgi:hypothetical protein
MQGIASSLRASILVVLEEGFRAVFGGTKPVAVPWAGLIYI